MQLETTIWKRTWLKSLNGNYKYKRKRCLITKETDKVVCSETLPPTSSMLGLISWACHLSLLVLGLSQARVAFHTTQIIIHKTEYYTIHVPPLSASKLTNVWVTAKLGNDRAFWSEANGFTSLGWRTLPEEFLCNCFFNEPEKIEIKQSSVYYQLIRLIWNHVYCNW